MCSLGPGGHQGFNLKRKIADSVDFREFLEGKFPFNSRTYESNERALMDTMLWG